MIVYVGFKNGIDWSDGRRYFATVANTRDEALERMGVDAESYDQSRELQAYFTVEAYDSDTGAKVPA